MLALSTDPANTYLMVILAVLIGAFTLILQVVSNGLNLIVIRAHLTLTLGGGILIFILFINQVREWFANVFNPTFRVFHADACQDN